MLLCHSHRYFALFSLQPLLKLFCNRTFVNTRFRRVTRRAQERAFRSCHAPRGSSVAAHPASSRTYEPELVKDPFEILFFGRDLFSCTVFKEVYKARDIWNSLHIVTNPDIKTGRRGSRIDVSPLRKIGETLGIPVHAIPEDKTAFKKWLPPRPFIPHPDGSNFQNASHLLITASFGRILPGSTLALFPSAQRLNVHPSLLPVYRGPAPIQRALMAGERETGVCVIEMGEVSRRAGKPVDAGSLWAVERMHIPESADFLYMQGVLAASGGRLLVKVLRNMLSGRAQNSPQEAMTLASPHAPLITAKDSAINFASQTALVITRVERAIGHQRSLTVATALPNGRGVTIAGLRVIPPELLPEIAVASETDCPGIAYYSPKTRSLIVKCAEGTWLGVDRLQTQDRAMLAAKEWWNGVKGTGGVFQFR